MNPVHEEILRHMLGADRKSKKRRGYRNRFCCGSKAHKDYKVLKDLEKVGLVVRYEEFDQLFFCATLSGARAIGLGKAALVMAGLILEASNSKAEIKAAEEMMLEEVDA
jgi:hypothetical protein